MSRRIEKLRALHLNNITVKIKRITDRRNSSFYIRCSVNQVLEGIAIEI